MPCLDAPHECQRLAAAGHTFTQPFTWAAITDQPWDIYQTLVNPGNTHRVV